MPVSPLAGKPAPPSMLINIPRLVTEYYTNHPDPGERSHQVEFGTSGHRGSSLRNSFNEDHIMAITQAICDYRKLNGILGPLFIGKDTHALSEPSFATALEVLAANEVGVFVQSDWGYTPTPVISHAILVHNRKAGAHAADGIVITPSHNPPEDGGFKYNPPNGGPADTNITSWVEKRANELVRTGNREAKRIPYERAVRSGFVRTYDFVGSYVGELASVIDMEAIRSAGIRIGVDPMGGSSLPCWNPIAEKYGLSLTIVSELVDPTFGFMTVDKDGKIRMDCSSSYAMARLIGLKDRFDVAFGNDPDSDRHGVVTRKGLMNPNHYLSAAVWYLFQNRPRWRKDAGIGKTLVSSAMIDRVARRLGRKLFEVPVGFKWFVEGLLKGTYGFGGEESAGASFLRMDGTAWSTDKDGIILDLLAAEITAKTEKDPSEIYSSLTMEFGSPCYERMDAPASPEQKSILKKLEPGLIKASTLAGEKILAKLSHAPGNGAAIGGIKVVAENGWFAARPSGTEDIYKIYTESFKSPGHLLTIQEEARAIVSEAFEAASA